MRWHPFASRARQEQLLDAEIREHVERLVDGYLAAGMDPAEARRRAALDFGGVDQAKDAVREERRFAVWDVLQRDLRLALRGWRRNPAFTVAVLLTLALGIGANTAIFSIVDGVLLRPAPLADMGRLAVVWETDRSSQTTREPGSVPDYLDYRDRARTLDGLTAFIPLEVNLTPLTGDSERRAGLRIAHDLLPMIGVRPILGRSFAPDDDVPGGPRIVLISAGLWHSTFAADPAIIGRDVRIDDAPYTVVGVVPDAAGFGVLQVLSAAAYSRSFADHGERTPVDVWLPLRPDPEALPRETHPIFMLGRLSAGASIDAAQDELAGIASDLERAYPENADRGIHVEALDAVVLGPVRPTLLVLLSAVALVLLVASANVANLLLARGASRRQEVAVRTALGAGRRRLLAQFVVETMLLALAGAGLGLGLASVALRALIAIAPPDIPRLATVGLDLRVLGVTLLVTLALGLAFGVIPAVQARRVPLQEALHAAGARLTGGPSRRRARASLVVAELALAVMLVAGAGLLIRSFWNLVNVDPGFTTSGVLKAEYQLPSARYPVDRRGWPTSPAERAFTETLLARVGALPGVTSTAVAANHPLDPGFTNSFYVVGRQAEARNWPEISMRIVTPSYFATMGIAITRGRNFADRDTSPVCLVNEAAVRQFFAGRDPMPGELRFWGVNWSILGVVGDEKFQGLSGADPPAVYVPRVMVPTGSGALLVRTAGDAAALAGPVRAVVRDIDPELAIFGLEPLDRTLRRSMSERRFAMTLVTLFGGLALLLAAIGVHGVLSYDVAERRREIGIRLALGAQPGSILRLVVGQGLALAGVALLAGLAGAFALTRFLSTLLFGVGPRDPVTLTVAAGVLTLVALAATAWPAWRAVRVDPVGALKTGE